MDQEEGKASYRLSEGAEPRSTRQKAAVANFHTSYYSSEPGAPAHSSRPESCSRERHDVQDSVKAPPYRLSL